MGVDWYNMQMIYGCGYIFFARYIPLYIRRKCKLLMCNIEISDYTQNNLSFNFELVEDKKLKYAHEENNDLIFDKDAQRVNVNTQFLYIYIDKIYKQSDIRVPRTYDNSEYDSLDIHCTNIHGDNKQISEMFGDLQSYIVLKDLPTNFVDFILVTNNKYILYDDDSFRCIIK